MVSYNFCRHSSKNYMEFLRAGLTDLLIGFISLIVWGLGSLVILMLVKTQSSLLTIRLEQLNSHRLRRMALIEEG